MSPASPAPPTVVSESPAPHLSRWSFGLALAITLAIFFLLHPLWGPIDMRAMDRNIVWSYAPIPLLVLVLLAIERKLRWSTWLIETIRLTFVKFAITFLVANLVWTITTPPAQAGTGAVRTSTRTSTGRFEVRPAPPATPIDASRTGRVAGVVLDPAGAPRAGVLVAVTGGLDGIVFAPRPEGVVLTHDGAGLWPQSGILLIYEPLTLRSEANDLHALRGVDEHDRQLFNTPLGPRTEHTLMFDHALGRVKLRCTVHDQTEPTAELAIVGNPFAAWTGDDGRFRFEGVPAGALELTASSPTGETASLAVSLEPGGAPEELRFALR